MKAGKERKAVLAWILVVLLLLLAGGLLLHHRQETKENEAVIIYEEELSLQESADADPVYAPLQL